MSLGWAGKHLALVSLIECKNKGQALIQAIHIFFVPLSHNSETGDIITDIILQMWELSFRGSFSRQRLTH